jgi:hypothetical protein
MRMQIRIRIQLSTLMLPTQSRRVMLKHSLESSNLVYHSILSLSDLVSQSLYWLVGDLVGASSISHFRAVAWRAGLFYAFRAFIGGQPLTNITSTVQQRHTRSSVSFAIHQASVGDINMYFA